MMTTAKKAISRRGALALGAAALSGLLAACGQMPDVAAPEEPAPAKAPAAAERKVLILLSSENKIQLKEGKEYATGYFLNELMIPTKALLDTGYTPVIATPRGTTPVMDVHSDDASFFGGDPNALEDIKRLRDSLPTYKAPRVLADVLREGLDGYAGVFVPGGHAAMGDLTREPQIGEVLRHFHEKKKPTALICHGPLALLSAAKNPPALVEAIAAGDPAAQKRESEGFPYAGYRVTVFSKAEEQTAEQGFLQGQVRFYPDEALRAAGAVVQTADPWKSHVVRDREVITGQQPNSDGELAKVLVEALRESASSSGGEPGRTGQLRPESTEGAGPSSH